MEQKLGNVGVADEGIVGGVAKASVSVMVPATAFGMSIKATLEVDEDANVLIDYLAAKIGGPIPAEVAVFLKTALDGVNA